MFNFTYKNAEMDKELKWLFVASDLLESMGNDVGLTTNDFYVRLLADGVEEEKHSSILSAAIAIESMLVHGEEIGEFETVH